MVGFFSYIFVEYCVHSVLNGGCAVEVLTLHMSQTFLWPHLSLSKINSRLSFPLCVSLHYPFTPSQQVFHISVGFSKDQLSEVKLFLSKVCVCMCVCSVDQHVPEVKSSVSKITRRGVLLPYSQCSVYVCLVVCFIHQEIVKCMRRKRERAVLGVKHKS